MFKTNLYIIYPYGGWSVQVDYGVGCNTSVKLALQSRQNNLKPFQQILLRLVGRCSIIVRICWNVY